MKRQGKRKLKRLWGMQTGGILLTLAALLALWGAAGAAGDAGPYPDVPADSWYAQTVAHMSQAGWLTGYPDGAFRPEAEISAAEFVTVVGRCAGLEDPPGASDYWASGWLAAALEGGWYDWDELPPTGEKYELPISRQLAVKILMKALLPDARGDYAGQAGRIADLAELDGRYYEAVFAGYAAGVVQGDETGCFRPKSGLTRAEACAMIQRAMGQRASAPAAGGEGETPAAQEGQAVRGGVRQNGRLHVSGTALCNERGEPVVLRGMSSHGLQWYPQFAGPQSIANTADYGANLFRAAMYTAQGGYLSDPEGMKAKVIQAVEAAIASDMYVIIDWHILSDGNPMDGLAQAREFFGEMAGRYGQEPAVLFEICNEPNGNVTWAGEIKPYAQQIVEVIREKAPESVILIGSGTWSQDVHHAAADPLKGENLMYTCHFYAGTHGQWLRERIDAALEAGLPIFVSEWGTSAADGSGGVFLEESAVWLDFLEARGISWANWSLCDKDESSAALKNGASPGGPWSGDDLTQSGRFVFSRFAG